MNKTQAILKMLKDAPEYLSGADASKALGISRTAVWKHINKLREDGYIIESVTNRGYKLIREVDTITAEKIADSLSTDFIGQNIVYFAETDSTNNAAKRGCDYPDGTLFIAEHQTLGKGRMGRSWVSPPGEGIWMSLLLKPSIPPSKAAAVTLAAGLSAIDAIGDDASIKWPNDVLINSKKVCGILTEMSAETDMVHYLIVGVGINVNNRSFPDDLINKATSLYIERNQSCDRCSVIRAFLESFERRYISFLNNGVAPIIDAYKQRCATLNRDVLVIRDGKTITAHALDIDETGSLVVESDGKRFAVNAGEVSVRGLLGYE